VLVLVGRGDATGTRAMGRASLPGDPAAGPPFSRTGMRCTTERYGAAGAPLGPRAPAGQGIPIIPKNSVLHPGPDTESSTRMSRVSPSVPPVPCLKKKGLGAWQRLTVTLQLSAAVAS
jgi:hypothetical protein